MVKNNHDMQYRKFTVATSRELRDETECLDDARDWSEEATKQHEIERRGQNYEVLEIVRINYRVWTKISAESLAYYTLR